MGNCLTIQSQRRIHPIMEMEGEYLEGKVIKNKIKNATGLKSGKIYIADNFYIAHKKENIERFLAVDDTHKLRYIQEKSDCDDFAFILLGRQREWFRYNMKSHPKFAGSTFGVIWGDIRLSEEDEEVRNHAMNFVVTSEKEFWLIEPQNDEWYRPTSNSRFFWAVC